MFIIKKNKLSLATNPESTWCEGVIGFSSTRAMMFKTSQEAEDYVLGLINSLTEWIEQDIPKQSIKWKIPNEFITMSTNRYNNNLKVLKSLKTEKL